MFEIAPIQVSRHAVEQYRARVLGCPERSRTDGALRKIIKDQADKGSWHLAGGETFVVAQGPLVPRRKKPWEMTVRHPTYTLVIQCRTVVTVLGYGMRATREKARKIRRRRLKALAASRLHAAANLIGEQR